MPDGTIAQPREKRLSSLIAALLEARGQLGHVVVNFRLFLHIIADAGIRVHDRGVIAAAEHFADIDQAHAGHLTGKIHGDLTASAADSADGHLDSYYASLFGRYQDRRWAHTLILTGGWNDAKLNRTVNYGEGSYGTQGSTSGWGFGAMYELTYDVYLNENRSSVLQPLFNASVVTTRMDGYEETGAGNAGLNVGRQDWTTGTLALGGRWMGLVGSNIFGREALAEIRVNAAQDLGDRRGGNETSLCWATPALRKA